MLLSDRGYNLTLMPISPGPVVAAKPAGVRAGDEQTRAERSTPRHAAWPLGPGAPRGAGAPADRRTTLYTARS